MLYYEQNRKTARDYRCFRQYCIFGGAGVSTESGIPDFRSESGIFKSLEKYGDTHERLVSHSYS